MFSIPGQRRLSSFARVTAAVLVYSSATYFVRGQTRRFCEGELGDAGWVCEDVQPVNPDVYEDFYTLPGTPDPANPARYKQIAGDPAFDAVTGLRNDNSAVFVITEGVFFCMLAESNGEAALFDAPEGRCGQTESASRWLYPTHPRNEVAVADRDEHCIPCRNRR